MTDPAVRLLGDPTDRLGLVGVRRGATAFAGGVEGLASSGLSVELQAELGTAIAWSRLESWPPAPAMQATDEPGDLAERLTAYFFRTTEDGQTWLSGYELAQASTIPDGYVRQGGFLFPNLARPILLLQLVRAWDALDEAIVGRLANIDRADTASLIARTAALGLISLVIDRVAPWDTWEALEVEHRRWLERKELYRGQLLAAIARDPWDPTGLSELVLDPIFTGWYPGRESRGMPDMVTPLVLARAVDVSVEAWKEATRLFGQDIRDSAPIDTLARLIAWVKANPKTAAGLILGGLAVVGLAPAIAQGAISGLFQRGAK